MTAILEFLYSLFQLISTHLQRKELDPCPLWKSLQTLVVYTSKEPNTSLERTPFVHWDTATGILGFPSRSKWNSSSEWVECPWFAPSFWHLVVVQLPSHVLLFVTPQTAARQAPLSSTVSWSLLKLMSIESVMPSSHLILCRPLLLLPSVFPRSGSFPVSLPDGTYIDLAFKQVHPIDSWRWGDYHRVLLLLWGSSSRCRPDSGRRHRCGSLCSRPGRPAGPLGAERYLPVWISVLPHGPFQHLSSSSTCVNFL